MIKNNYNRTDIALQSIDFFTLRKPNPTPTCKIEGNALQFINYPNSALLMMGVYAIAYETIEIDSSDFSQFPFESIPKQFQQFAHEKTSTEIFNILKKQGKGLELIVQLLNNYPVFVFVLECWVRRNAMIILNNYESIDFMGNEQQILVDLANQIRGPLLGLIASSLKIYLKTKFQFLPTVEEVQCEEQFGQPSSKWELQIQFKLDNVSSGVLVEKQGQNSLSCPTSKATQCGYLRRSKMGQSETETRTGAQFKSVKKQRGGYCQKCGPGKRCQCNQIKRRGYGYGITPKANQVSSLGNIKSDPFAVGLVNEHYLSKMRESNTNQR